MSLQRAREAAADGNWEAGYELLMEADSQGLVGPAELPLLAEVAYAAGHLDVTIEAWERAHALCVEAQDPVAAAGAAVRVAMHLLFDTALMAPVRGWLARAEHLLEGHRETPAHAWLAVVRTYERSRGGVDRRDGAVVPHERHRERPWPVSRASRGDHAAAWGVRRRGARGAGGLRGAEAVSAP